MAAPLHREFTKGTWKLEIDDIGGGFEFTVQHGEAGDRLNLDTVKVVRDEVTTLFRNFSRPEQSMIVRGLQDRQITLQGKDELILRVPTIEKRIVVGEREIIISNLGSKGQPDYRASFKGENGSVRDADEFKIEKAGEKIPFEHLSSREQKKVIEQLGPDQVFHKEDQTGIRILIRPHPKDAVRKTVHSLHYPQNIPSEMIMYPSKGGPGVALMQGRVSTNIPPSNILIFEQGRWTKFSSLSAPGKYRLMEMMQKDSSSSVMVDDRRDPPVLEIYPPGMKPCPMWLESVEREGETYLLVQVTATKSGRLEGRVYHLLQVEEGTDPRYGDRELPKKITQEHMLFQEVGNRDLIPFRELRDSETVVDRILKGEYAPPHFVVVEGGQDMIEFALPALPEREEGQE